LREDWLTADRVTRYTRLVLALYIVFAIAWVGLSRDGIDRAGKPLGADFIIYYAASELALQGKLAEAWDPEKLSAAERAAVPANTEAFPWLYPPTFALVIFPLALMPYGLAFAAFMGLTLALYLWLIHAAFPDRRAAIVALAFTGAFVNAAGGQNGFLSAALLGGGLLLLETRPILAGALFGLLTYKPQLGLLLPFVVVAGRRWRCIAAAASTAALFALASLAGFGPEAWRSFWEQLANLPRLLEAGVFPWDKMASVFAAARLLGINAPVSYALHGIVAVAATVLSVIGWRASDDPRLRAALAAAAAPLLSPYIYDYDLVLLALPIALLAADGIAKGWQPGVRNVLTLAWAAPLPAAALARYLHLPLLPLVLIALFAVTYRRVRTPQP